MNDIFNHYLIEKKWVKIWEKNNIFKFNINSKKKKYYILDMFPYPSNSGLHLGHPRGYTASDIIARFKKLQGYEILHPIGWDSFGLPAEQYAIKNNLNIEKAINDNILNFTKQLKQLGLSFDWNLCIKTSDPKYYKWTQWFISQMYKDKLLVKKNISVNWCQELNTVLAKEELYEENNKLYSLIDDHLITQKNKSQWVIKINKYAEKLLSDIKLVKWPENIIRLQTNLINKKEFYKVLTKVNNVYYKFLVSKNQDNIFTNKSYGIIGLNSNLFKIISIPDKLKNKILKYEELPNYILKKSNYKILIPNVYINIQNLKLKVYLVTNLVNKVQKNGIIINNSKNTEKYNLKNENNKIIITYDLSDWIFSRQRYWGEPFPFYYDDNGKLFLSSDLPLILPSINNIAKIHNTNKNPLENIKKWYYFKKNNKVYHFDSNVMPQWAGSSWYYLAYIWKAAELFYKKDLDIYDSRCIDFYNKFLPVDLYIGGQEHAVLHLIYARFWNKYMNKINITKHKEPFINLQNQGMILGKDNKKMSKSKNNYVNPDKIIEKYGADSLRLTEMFLGPLNFNFKWDNNVVKSLRKWLNRYYLMFTKKKSTNASKNNKTIYSKTVNETKKLITSMKFNVVISKIMEYVNYCYHNNEFYFPFLKNINVILSCFCPFICEEININILKNDKYIYLEKWPSIDNNILVPKRELMILINNKFKEKIIIKKNTDKSEIIQIIKKMSRFQKYFSEKKNIKIIYKENKLINFIF